MDKHKLKVFLLIFLFSIIWIVSFFVFKDDKSLNNTQENENKSLSKVEEKFDPNNYKDVQSYLKTIKVDWIDLEKESFVIKNNNSIFVVDKGNFTDYNNDRTKLNALLTDINNSYSSKTIRKYKINSNDKSDWIRFLTEEELSENARFHNEILSPYEGKSFLQLKEELENKKNKTSKDYEKLSFLNSYSWDYKKSNFYRDMACKKDNSICKNKVSFSFTWKVLDDKWNPIENAIVELLNDISISTKTNSKWEYELKFETYSLERLRIRAYSENTSDWFFAYSTVFDEVKTQNEKADFTLHTPNKVLKLWNDDLENWYYNFSTDFTQYKIDKESIIDKSWKHYNWNIKVYLYEFNKSTNMGNYMNNDTFDSVYWYVWNIMKTFWMPYIQIFNLSTNEELYIKKDLPAKLTVQVQNMKELYENHDKIYEAITAKDMQFLLDSTDKICWIKENCYPINRQWLIDNEFVKWPAWWVLNRTKWTWENVWAKILDTKWKFETIFYSVE